MYLYRSSVVAPGNEFMIFFLIDISIIWQGLCILCQRSQDTKEGRQNIDNTSYLGHYNSPVACQCKQQNTHHKSVITHCCHFIIVKLSPRLWYYETWSGHMSSENRDNSANGSVTNQTLTFLVKLCSPYTTAELNPEKMQIKRGLAQKHVTRPLLLFVWAAVTH